MRRNGIIPLYLRYFKGRSLALLAPGILLLASSTVQAQVGSNFGRNKVQYREFDWAILATEHFDIYYYEEERPLALRAARMAERSYAMLSDVLDHDIETRVPLILYTSHNDFRQTNTVGGIIPEGVQGVTESLKNRVVLPFTGSYSQFNHVLTHELVHAFQFDLTGQSGRRMNPVQRPVPLWFMEGMAEFLSVGMDKGTELWLRDALVHDELIPISKLNVLADIRVYRFGQALWYYISETYGRETVGELLKQTVSYGTTKGVFSEVLGVSSDELSLGWHQWIRDNFRSVGGSGDLDSLAVRLTAHTSYLFNLNLMPSVSPAGDRVAYLSNKHLYNDILLKDLNHGGEEKVLLHGGRSGSFESLRFLDTQISWSSDGGYMALAGVSNGRDAICVIDAESGERVRELSPDMGGLISPSFSPDGDRIVFTGIRRGQSDLYVIDLDETRLVQLTNDIYSDLQPRWSPDGESIAFATDRGVDTDKDRLLFGRLEIAVYELSTGRIRVITSLGEECHNPIWSPDGGKIAFISPLEGSPNISTADVESGRLERVTDLAAGVGGITPSSPAFSWSHDGDSLVFSSFSRGGWDIFLLEERAEETGHEVVESRDHWSHADYEAYQLPDSLEAAGESYRSQFGPDVLVGGVGYSNNVGVAGQSYLLLSDILGDHNIMITTGIYGDIAESDLLFSYINLAHRTNYAVTAFQSRNDFGLFTAPDSAGFASQMYRGGSVVFSRPFDMFTRVEYGASAMFLEREVFSQSFITSETTVDSSSVDFLVRPTVALVRDNSIFGTTGPVAGQRFRLQAEGGIGQIRFATLSADYRLYVNFSRRYTLALWLLGAGSFGGNAQIFRIGGPYTFRGADFGSIAGTRVFMQNTEFRFPILFMLLPTYDFLRGVVFWDMAAGWDDEFHPITVQDTRFVRLNDLRGAYGAGARLGAGYLILRIDVSQETDLRGRVGDVRGFFSIGADF